MRSISLTWDITYRAYRDAADALYRSERQWPTITYGEEVLFNVRVVESSTGTVVAVPIDTPDLMSAVIDLDFDWDTAPFVRNVADSFNQTGDWHVTSPATTASLALGQISFKMLATDPAFKTRLGNAGRLPRTLLEIRAITDSVISFTTLMPIISVNLLEELDPPIIPTFQVGQKFVIASDGVRRVAYLFSDDVYRVLMPILVDGVPTHYWEEVEEVVS